MYSIDYDNRVLTIRLTSFWSAATHAKFLVEVTARALTALFKHGKFCIFVDCSDYPIQAPELVKEFEPMILRAKGRGLPVVLLLQSTLAVLQARRSLGETGVGIFTERHAAESCVADSVRRLTDARQATG